MGAFYVGIYVKNAAPQEIAEFFSAFDDSGFVGEQMNGWTFVTSEALEEQNQDLIDAYGLALSERFGGPAVAVLNHDDDFLSVDLFENGRAVADFNSCPGYFNEDATEDELKPRWSRPEKFAAFVTGLSIDELTGVAENEVFASDTHGNLARLLGLPSISVGAGHHYIVSGEFKQSEWIGFGGAVSPSV